MSVLKHPQYAALAIREGRDWDVFGGLLSSISPCSDMKVSLMLDNNTPSIQVEFMFKGEEYKVKIDPQQCATFECMHGAYFMPQNEAEREKKRFWTEIKFLEHPTMGFEKQTYSRSRGGNVRYNFMFLSLTKVQANKIERAESGLEKQGKVAETVVKKLEEKDNDLEIIILWDQNTSTPQLDKFARKCEQVKRTLQSTMRETADMLRAGEDQKQESKKLKESEKAKEKPQSPIRKNGRSSSTRLSRGERLRDMERKFKEEKARKDKEIEVKKKRDAGADTIEAIWEEMVAAKDGVNIKADENGKVDTLLEILAKSVETMKITQAARKALDE